MVVVALIIMYIVIITNVTGNRKRQFVTDVVVEGEWSRV